MSDVLGIDDQLDPPSSGVRRRDLDHIREILANLTLRI